MPRWLDRLQQRINAVTRARRMDASLRREIDLHIREQTDEYIAAGMEPTDARAAAIRAFGQVSRIEEECRDMRRVSFIQNVARDVRYTLRSLRQQPLLVIAATLSMAAGIGANTTIFSLARQILIDAPMAARPHELAYVRVANASHVSYLQWRDLEDGGAVAGIAGYGVEVEVNWRGPDQSIALVPLLVTPNFFDVVDPPIAMGRGFTAAEAQPDRGPGVAVVSHGFWTKRLGRDPNIVGRTLTFNGRPYTVRGVLPAGLRAFPGYGIAPEVYLPLGRAVIPDLYEPRAAAVQLVARLKPGQTHSVAAAALATVAQHLDTAHPERQTGGLGRYTPLGGFGQFQDTAEVGAFFALLLVVSALVLAIACGNVAGLLFARGTVRRREIAVRVALGASRGRLLQQLLTEGLWLAAFGTVCGLVMMILLMRLVERVPLPIPLPLELRAQVDAATLGYSLALLIVTTLLCGLAPAIHATRPSLVPALKQDEWLSGARRWTLRNLLVAAQVATAMVLLVTAFLFLRNLARASAANPGFDVAKTLVAQMGFVTGRHAPEDRARILVSAVDRLRGLPDVESATYAAGVPLTIRSGVTRGAMLVIAGAGQPFQATYQANFVGPEYFRTMGIRLVSGREFRASDRTGAPAVAVVNEEFVRRYMAGRSAVGRQVLLPGYDTSYPAEIVGVVTDSKYRSIGEHQRPAVYESFLQRGNRDAPVHVIVRTFGSPADSVRTVQRVLEQLDASAAVSVRTMESTMSFAFLPSRVGAAILGTLGALGVLLAMVGLYAVVAYAVSRRRGEIGIRMALGATQSSVLRMVLRDAAVLAGAGIALGLAIAAFITEPLAMFLVSGLSARDPLTFAGTALLLAGVSLAAAWAPARRAMRTDPAAALRAE